MSGYQIALFLHLIGVIVMFIALGIGQRAGARLRGAASIDHARLWLGLLKVTTPMFPTALVLLLGSGIFMSASAWSPSTPWIVVSMVGIVVIGTLGSGIVIRGVGRMARAIEETGQDQVSASVRSAINDAMTWTSLFAINALSFALLWLMVMKPGWVQSIALPTVLTTAGGISGWMSTRRRMWIVPDRPSTDQ